MRLRTPAPVLWGRSSSAERSFDMREVKRAARFIPTISEGIAQPARADASHASGRRRKSSCPHHFCPCGVVQPTRLPLMQEITGAKPVRDAIFHRRVVHGEKQTHLTQNQAALDVQVVSRRPFSKPPKHCQRCACSVGKGTRCNSGWGPHSSSSGSVAVEPALRQVS